jgi:cell division protein FtsW (lipid II flippase)
MDLPAKQRKTILAVVIIFICLIIFIPNVAPSIKCYVIGVFTGFSFGCVFRIIITLVTLSLGLFLIYKIKVGFNAY